MRRDRKVVKVLCVIKAFVVMYAFLDLVIRGYVRVNCNVPLLAQQHK
jgi:hypothetical protein